MVYGKCTTLFRICQKNNWQLTTGKVLCALWGLEHKAIITNHQLPIRNNCQLSIAQLFSGRSLRTTTPVCHISLSRKAFNSSFSFSR